MYKREFERLKELPKFLAFFGDKFYLEKTQKDIIKKFQNDNIIKFFFDEYDFEKIKSYLIENSLFGGRNVVILKHNKIPPKIEKLEKYAKENYFFFFYYGDKKLEFKNSVRFFEPSFKEKFLIIEKLAKEFNVEITKEAIKFLVNSVEPILFQKEIEKLANYKNYITLDDVKEICFIYKEESFEELFVSILKGEDFFEKLNSLLELVDFNRIIPALIKYINNLYQYHLYIKLTGKNSLKEFLGYQLPLDIEKNRISLAMKFKEKDFLSLLKTLLEYELKMRVTEKNKEAIFWEAMIFLKSFSFF